MTTDPPSTRRRDRNIAAIVVALAVAGAGCSAAANDSTDAAPAVPVVSGTEAVLPTVATGTVVALSADELAGLLWMREEEQLAHDVYVALSALWGVRIFDNIAASESAHVDSTIALLDRYGIDDPAAGNAPGEFTNPQIQTLFDQLVANGNASLDAALAVGARIEELDISDLQDRAATTSHADIASVYANLERASRNHLRAFASQLETRGVAYVPTRLDPAVYDAIVAGAIERGPGA